jgi:hypothetical protein
MNKWNRAIALFLFAVVCMPVFADWKFYEETHVNGSASGTVKKGHIFTMQSGSIYQVSESTLQLVLELARESLILRNGELFKLVIEGFDEPVICRQLSGPTHLPTDPSGGRDPNTLSSGATFPDITLDTLMPKEVQKKAGIQKLDKNEKEYLRKFLIDYYMLGIKQRANETSVSKPLKRPRPAVVESQIEGDFKGWEGETIIKLLNGQVWQQIEYYYIYHYAFMPEVFIYKSASGYKMKVDGVNKAIGVKQIR